MKDETTEGAQTPEPEPAPSGDLAALAADLDAQRSEPSDGAIAAHEATEAARAAQYAELRDAQGLAFDASLHVTDTDGTPKLTASGKLRRRPGRKAGGSAKPSSIGGTSRTAERKANDAAQSRSAGIELANLMIALSIQVGGDDFQPDEGEQTHIENVFARYAEIKGFKEISPGWALAITVGGYYSKRLVMPRTQSRLQNAKTWFAQQLVKIRMRNNGARGDIRNDGKRENDASKTPRESFPRPK